jgi:hypothetical protein
VETCTACCLCYTGQADGLRWSDRWAVPVRPVATIAAQNVLESLSDSLGPRTNTHPNTTGTEEEPYTKPSKTTPRRPRTDQQHHNPKRHGSSNSLEANPTKRLTLVRPVKSTGHAWSAQDEQHPRVNSSKINSRFTPRIRTRLWG